MSFFKILNRLILKILRQARQTRQYIQRLMMIGVLSDWGAKRPSAVRKIDAFIHSAFFYFLTNRN